MPLFALSVPAFVVPTFGVTVIQKSKRDTEIVVMRLLESSKKLERTLLLSKLVTLLLPLSHTVVDSVMLVELVLMVLVTITQVTTGLVAYRLSISVSTLLIGLLSKFLVNLQIIAKACLSHF